MKIALYVSSWPPGNTPTGIVTYASQLVPALRKLGHEVYILTHCNDPAHVDRHTIDLKKYAPTRNLWQRVVNRVRPKRVPYNNVTKIIVRALEELIKTDGLDVFEIEETFGWNAAINKRKLLPVVVRLHGPHALAGPFFEEFATGSLDRDRLALEGQGISSAQYVTSPSAVALEGVRNYYGFNLSASDVIPNPFQAADEAVVWKPSNENANTILFVGRFDILKGGDVVVRMFVKLANSRPGLKLKFIGPDSGITTQDGEVRNFEQFVQDHVPERLRKQIDFSGSKPASSVMEERSKAFLTVVASRYETFPYSLLEAMSFGCPLIATNVGGISELIFDGRNGLLVPSEDPDAMASACLRLLDDPELAKRLGRQAWEDSRERYRPARIAELTLTAYQSAIDRFKAKNLRR